jgi:hypothetical protein
MFVPMARASMPIPEFSMRAVATIGRTSVLGRMVSPAMPAGSVHQDFAGLFRVVCDDSILPSMAQHTKSILCEH